jgi:Fe-S cluster biogenesis protein NfuA
LSCFYIQGIYIIALRIHQEAVMEEYICNTIGPRIRGDGGWVEFVSYEDRCLTLIFRGECSKCIILNRCLDWIRQEILRDLREDVTIKPICKKPFFWDH